jgi:cyclopropane fatty-acyl-phospholipid synthase-like methyltransferase
MERVKAYERGNKFYLLRHFSNVKDNLEKKRPVKWHNILQKKRIWILILIPVALVVLFLARVNPWIAEYIFARGIYKQLAQVFSLMAGIVPFSIMENHKQDL